MLDDRENFSAGPEEGDSFYQLESDGKLAKLTILEIRSGPYGPWILLYDETRGRCWQIPFSALLQQKIFATLREVRRYLRREHGQSAILPLMEAWSY